MKFAAAPLLVVPAGTAAAAVVAREAAHDPALAERQWASIAALPDDARHVVIEKLLAQGVLARLENRVLVLRIICGGVRSFAAIVAPAETSRPAATRRPEPIVESHALQGASPSFSEAVEAACRVRPIFHGAADDGCTYSGFEVDEPESMLAALEAAVGSAGPRAQVASRSASAYFSGDKTPIPAGLVLVL